MNTQPRPLPQPSTNLQVQKIHMSSVHASHMKVSNTTKDKFQYQWTLIRLMQTNRSNINDVKMVTKTPKNNILWIKNQRNNNNLYRFTCSSINQYLSKQYDNNLNLNWLDDCLRTNSMAVMIEMTISMTYLFNMNSGFSML